MAATWPQADSARSAGVHAENFILQPMPRLRRAARLMARCLFKEDKFHA
jgi:hypothetical protein